MARKIKIATQQHLDTARHLKQGTKGLIKPASKKQRKQIADGLRAARKKGFSGKGSKTAVNAHHSSARSVHRRGAIYY